MHFIIKADKALSLSLRIPQWCKGATVSTGGDTPAQDNEGASLPSGTMHAVSIAAGSRFAQTVLACWLGLALAITADRGLRCRLRSTVTLTLPLEIRVTRRAPYAINASHSVDTNAANIYRGPVLYAAPRDFTLDHAKPYDDAPGARNP